MIFAAGQGTVISNNIVPILEDRYKLDSIHIDYGDICDYNRLYAILKQHRPEILIDCYEFPNVPEAEYQREEVYRINALSAKAFAEACRDNDITIIYLSTTHLFNDEKGIPLGEEVLPAPASVFADSKHLAERMIIESGARHVILRLPDYYGRGVSLFNFPFCRKKGDKAIELLGDYCFCPTALEDIAGAIANMIDNHVQGIFHFSQDGCTTALEYANTVLEIAGRYNQEIRDFELHNYSGEDYITVVESGRANLCSWEKYKNTTGVRPREWKTALEDYIKNNIETVIL